MIWVSWLKPFGNSGRSGRSIRRAELLPDAEALDQPVIALRAFGLQIVEQAPAAPDELQEAAAGVVILRVRLEVLGQVDDPVRQQRDLHLGRARVGVVGAVLRN